AAANPCRAAPSWAYVCDPTRRGRSSSLRTLQPVDPRANRRRWFAALLALGLVAVRIRFDDLLRRGRPGVRVRLGRRVVITVGRCLIHAERLPAPQRANTRRGSRAPGGPRRCG